MHLMSTGEYWHSIKLQWIISSDFFALETPLTTEQNTKNSLTFQTISISSWALMAIWMCTKWTLQDWFKVSSVREAKNILVKTFVLEFWFVENEHYEPIWAYLKEINYRVSHTSLQKSTKRFLMLNFLNRIWKIIFCHLTGSPMMVKNYRKIIAFMKI